MMDPLTWIMWAWLCSATTSECRPMPDVVMPSRAECIQAAAMLRNTSGGLIIAHCRAAHAR